MSLLPIDSFRTPGAASRREAPASTKRFSLLLAALAVLCTMSASAQLPGFTMTNNGPLTLPSQQYGPVTVTITPTGGFSQQISLTCSNLPVYASCNFPNSNSSVNLSGGPATETVVINTSQINEYLSRSARPGSGLSRVALGTLFAPAACLLLFARKRRMRFGIASRLLLCVVALYPLAGLAGCAAVKPNATPAGTYNILVTGSYSLTSASTVITLHVT